jgi:Uma2 family endonuclease
MVSPTKRMTIEEFDKWVFLPENLDKSFEFIGGEIVEVVSNNYSSEIAGEMLFQIKLFLRENKLKGHVTGADGGYIVSGERIF